MRYIRQDIKNGFIFKHGNIRYKITSYSDISQEFRGKQLSNMSIPFSININHFLRCMNDGTYKVEKQLIDTNYEIY